MQNKSIQTKEIRKKYVQIILIKIIQIYLTKYMNLNLSFITKSINF